MWQASLQLRFPLYSHIRPAFFTIRRPDFVSHPPNHLLHIFPRERLIRCPVTEYQIYMVRLRPRMIRPKNHRHPVWSGKALRRQLFGLNEISKGTDIDVRGRHSNGNLCPAIRGVNQTIYVTAAPGHTRRRAFHQGTGHIPLSARGAVPVQAAGMACQPLYSPRRTLRPWLACFLFSGKNAM